MFSGIIYMSPIKQIDCERCGKPARAFEYARYTLHTERRGTTVWRYCIFCYAAMPRALYSKIISERSAKLNLCDGALYIWQVPFDTEYTYSKYIDDKISDGSCTLGNDDFEIVERLIRSNAARMITRFFRGVLEHALRPGGRLFLEAQERFYSVAR